MNETPLEKVEGLVDRVLNEGGTVKLIVCGIKASFLLPSKVRGIKVVGRRVLPADSVQTLDFDPWEE